MVIVVVTLALVAVGLVVALGLEVAQSRTLRATVADLDTRRARLAKSVEEAERDQWAHRQAREEALERAARAKREGAELARRLRDETAARERAEQALADARAGHDALAGQLEDAEGRAAAAADDAASSRVEELWAMALADVSRTWEISVSPSPGLPSPLLDADDQLRVAAEIEVDAAREEAGAVIELHWTDGGRPAGATALRALSIVQGLVAELAKTAEEAALSVTTSDASVDIVVEASDAAGATLDPDVAPDHRTGPGRYRISLGAAVRP